jgi:hypothetical protein
VLFAKHQNNRRRALAKTSGVEMWRGQNSPTTSPAWRKWMNPALRGKPEAQIAQDVAGRERIARSGHKSVIGKFCFPRLLVHAFWFASELTAAAPVLTHNVKLISGWPLPHTICGAAGPAGFIPGRQGHARRGEGKTTKAGLTNQTAAARVAASRETEAGSAEEQPAEG